MDGTGHGQDQAAAGAAVILAAQTAAQLEARAGKTLG